MNSTALNNNQNYLSQSVVNSKTDEERALMRDTAWRYVGFADEAGEILKPYLGQIGRVTGYGVSGVYCLVDLFLTAKQMNQKGAHLPDRQRRLKVAGELLDLGIFHTFATMLVPPVLIGKTVSWTQKHLSPKHPKHFKRAIAMVQRASSMVGRLMTRDEAAWVVQNRLSRPLPVFVGIAMIPLIAHPFDLLMEKVQDWTSRLLLGKHRLAKVPGDITISPDPNGGQSKVTQAPPQWRPIPNADYWKPARKTPDNVSVQASSDRTTAHRHPHFSHTSLQQPHLFRNAFGEWPNSPEPLARYEP